MATSAQPIETPHQRPPQARRPAPVSISRPVKTQLGEPPEPQVETIRLAQEEGCLWTEEGQKQNNQRLADTKTEPALTPARPIPCNRTSNSTWPLAPTKSPTMKDDPRRVLYLRLKKEIRELHEECVHTYGEAELRMLQEMVRFKEKQLRELETTMDGSSWISDP